MGFMRKLIKDERGFIADIILVGYLVAFISMLAFILGLGYGTVKQANAKYGFFREAVDFSSEAVMLMSQGQYKRNESLGKTFFTAAMDELDFGEYKLVSFRAIEEGDSVFGETAPADGFAAEIRAPIAVLKVPLVGEYTVTIPMQYYSIGQGRRGEDI
ncbi:MAG: hypothetical protein GX088_04060 [Clostridia bacterium]|nr:hypothetical protein [Clostridia bacterium]